ncbi:hypothetical protein [Actinomycetospora sp. TBRC 11914]|uniref:hypothetical protein n=1 Tax=Actinomycetospora sp. TBRC 11914 TaxID=2729387 RepID=UPI00145CD5B9|nr:hypothetical protein [Actinomycetospora sp. TBRC 11914]NMO90350.1 hypothetical protein [Actinomycetospora sp. TBRC 11914]
MTRLISLVERARPEPDGAAPDDVEGGAPTWHRLRPWTPLALAALAVALLPLAAVTVDLDAMGGLGLGGVLPVWGWASIVLAVAACVLEIARPRPVALALLTGVLILCTTGMPSVVEPAARLGITWLHAGFVDAITRAGGVPRGIDSRLSWPGFFAQWAWIQDAAGMRQLDTVLRWAPIAIVGAWAAGVFQIARGLLGGTRAPWVATWLFCGENWIEQDYFSPQATAMILVLAVLAAAVGPLAAPATGPRRAAEPRYASTEADTVELAAVRPYRVGALIDRVRWWLSGPSRPDTDRLDVLIQWGGSAVCLAALVAAHQLTPFAIGAQLLVLVVARRLWGRHLLLVLVLAVTTWFVLGAAEFWVNQLGLATSSVGQVGSSISGGLGDRLVGDVGQLVGKFGRVALAGATWGLALLGAWWRWRQRRELVVLALAAVPVTIVLLQSYGGEVLLRILLYGLPFLAVLGTEALRVLHRRWTSVALPVFAAGMVLLCAAVVVLRGGNDVYLSVRPHDVQVVRETIEAAPAGTSVYTLGDHAPLGIERLADVNQFNTAADCQPIIDDPIRCVLANPPEYLVVLRQGDAEGVVLGGRSPGWTRQAIAEFVAEGWYRIQRVEGDAVVLERTRNP